MKIFAVVPARAGSKGLPGKNIKTLLGKPLIAWSIEQGLASKYVDHVFVSTESSVIADIATKYGAIVPCLRPLHLAQDQSATSDVLIHAINAFTKAADAYTHILLLEPTSPLRSANDIDKAIEMLMDKSDAKSVVGISLIEAQHPEFTVSLDSEGYINSANNFKVLRRQDIKPLYYYEGSVYLSEIGYFLSKQNFYHEKTLGLIMPKWKAYEIDDEIDFLITEALLKHFKNE